MKVLSIVFVALFAAVSVQAAANAEAGPDAAAEARIRHFCHRPGQSCGKVKRAAEAAAEALAMPEAGPEADPRIHRFCHRPGQSCGKAKRAAEALADAVADAYAAADPGKSLSFSYSTRGGFKHSAINPLPEEDDNLGS